VRKSEDIDQVIGVNEMLNRRVPDNSGQKFFVNVRLGSKTACWATSAK
jgi:hypothetical protein